MKHPPGCCELLLSFQNFERVDFGSFGQCIYWCFGGKDSGVSYSSIVTAPSHLLFLCWDFDTPLTKRWEGGCLWLLQPEGQQRLLWLSRLGYKKATASISFLQGLGSEYLLWGGQLPCCEGAQIHSLEETRTRGTRAPNWRPAPVFRHRNKPALRRLAASSPQVFPLRPRPRGAEMRGLCQALSEFLTRSILEHSK